MRRLQLKDILVDTTLHGEQQRREVSFLFDITKLRPFGLYTLLALYHKPSIQLATHIHSSLFLTPSIRGLTPCFCKSGLPVYIMTIIQVLRTNDVAILADDVSSMTVDIHFILMPKRTRVSLIIAPNNGSPRRCTYTWNLSNRVLTIWISIQHHRVDELRGRSV